MAPEYWGRLYERWISYPVDKSYPMNKSPIQCIAIHQIKMRCTKHDSTVNSYPSDNLNFNRGKLIFLKFPTSTSTLLGICENCPCLILV